MFQSASYSGSNLMFKDNTKQLDLIQARYQDYLGQDYITAITAIDCMGIPIILIVIQ